MSHWVVLTFPSSLPLFCCITPLSPFLFPLLPLSKSPSNCPPSFEWPLIYLPPLSSYCKSDPACICFQPISQLFVALESSLKSIMATKSSPPEPWACFLLVSLLLNLLCVRAFISIVLQLPHPSSESKSRNSKVTTHSLFSSFPCLVFGPPHSRECPLESGLSYEDILQCQAREGAQERIIHLNEWMIIDQ